MSVPIRFSRFMLVAAICHAAYAQDVPAAMQSDMRVDVRHEGNAVLIDVSMPVNASPRQVWQVLTDYNHMASFFPGINSSKAIQQSPDRIRVEQTGVVNFGPLRFPFESVRDVKLQPYQEIRSEAVGGTITSGFAHTRLIERGNATIIEYRSESVPNIRLPFGLGLNTVAARTREQFAQLRQEIYRRMETTAHTSGK